MPGYNHLASEKTEFRKAEECTENTQSKKGLTKSQNIEPRINELLLEESKLLATFLYQKTENTRIAYQTDIKKFFAFYRGKTLKDITSAHIVVYFKNHPELKSSTRARIKSSLSSLFKFCVRQRYLTENPCEHLDPIKVPDQTQFRILSIEEVRRMIELEPSPRNQFFIQLIARTGLRISEAIYLTLENFKERDGDCFLIVIGKGHKTRTIRIPKEYLNRASSLLEKEGQKLRPDAPLFRPKNSTSKSISKKAGWDIVKKAALRASLSSKVSPHWLRHFHATYSLKMGDDLRVIQKTLGHSSIATTTKYAEVSPEQSSGESINL